MLIRHFHVPPIAAVQAQNAGVFADVTGTRNRPATRRAAGAAGHLRLEGAHAAGMVGAPAADAVLGAAHCRALNGRGPFRRPPARRTTAALFLQRLKTHPLGVARVFHTYTEHIWTS